MREESALVLHFAFSVLRHWGALVTSGVFIGGLGMWQGTGHPVAHWVYWMVAVFGLVIAFYKAWLNEYQQTAILAAQLKGVSAHSESESTKKDLIRIITVLRDLQEKTIRWRGITNHNWGLAGPIGKLLPADWSGIIYEAGKLSSELRSQVEAVGRKVFRAEELVTEFQNQPPSFRQEPLVNQAYILFDEAIPILAKVLAAFESAEALIQRKPIDKSNS